MLVSIVGCQALQDNTREAEQSVKRIRHILWWENRLAMSAARDQAHLVHRRSFKAMPNKVAAPPSACIRYDASIAIAPASAEPRDDNRPTAIVCS